MPVVPLCFASRALEGVLARTPLHHPTPPKPSESQATEQYNLGYSPLNKAPLRTVTGRGNDPKYNMLCRDTAAALWRYLEARLPGLGDWGCWGFVGNYKWGIGFRV